MINELRINDVFWTIQGEGEHAGRRALFVRMPFCNLKCEWCDTEFNTFTKWTEKQLRDYALLETARFAVITGGEPALNTQTPKVLEILKRMGFYVAIESNGTAPIPRGFDFITISPKRDANYYVFPANETVVSEYKYVIDDGFNWEILLRHTDTNARLSLSPEWGRFEKSVNEIIEYVKENPKWRISLQTHKFLKVP